MISTALPSWISRRLSAEFQLIEISYLHLVTIGLWRRNVLARGVHLDFTKIQTSTCSVIFHEHLVDHMDNAWCMAFPIPAVVGSISQSKGGL